MRYVVEYSLFCKYFFDADTCVPIDVDRYRFNIDFFQLAIYCVVWGREFRGFVECVVHLIECRYNGVCIMEYLRTEKKLSTID